MRNTKELKAEKDIVLTLKSLSRAYQEIAVMRMQEVRSSVLSTREFLESLSAVFSDVKISYRKEIEKLLEERKRATTLKLLPFMRSKKTEEMDNIFKKNGKTVSVLLSSNAKLYGDIIPKVFFSFVEFIKKNESDVVIIGRYGKELFQQHAISRDYQYFELPDTKATFADVEPVMSYLLKYEKVEVFYGKFENVISQTPVSAILTGEGAYQKEQDASIDGAAEMAKKKINFFFEPSLEHVLNFFESQFMLNYFKQSVHEGELARQASRITAMEESLTNIEKREKSLRQEYLRLKKMKNSRKQMARLANVLFER